MGSDILINRLTVAFGAGSDAAAVKNLTTRFFSGQVTGLIGESGSGKSVLGMSILRLLPSSARLSGAIEFDGENLLSLSAREMQALRGSRIGLIPQSPGDSLDKVLRIRVQLEEALLAHSGQGRKEARRRAVELLKAFHFEDVNRVMQSYPFQLSGGMQQRVVSAMGLSCGPEWLIADEPTKGLDAVLREQVYSLLDDIAQNHIKSMIIITHDLSLAARVCHRLLVMYQGRVVEEGPAGEVLASPLHPYTAGLLAAMPSRGMNPLPPPDPSVPATGCPFAARCTQRLDRCTGTVPPMRAQSGRKARCYLHADG